MSFFTRTFPSKEIQAAVDLQMQPLWSAVSSNFSESLEKLNEKQKKIDELCAWANKTENEEIRTAQRHWISVAQYTIDRERKRIEETKAALVLQSSLPPLPNIEREFPYK